MAKAERSKPRSGLPEQPGQSAGKVDEPDGGLAWGCLRCHLRLWLVLGLTLLADLWSKHAVFKWLGEPYHPSIPEQIPESYTVIQGFLELRTQYNPGAVFGIMQGYGILFVLVGLASLALFLYLFGRSERGQRSLHVGVALFLAGALGNIYDRLLFNRVRDFLHITLKLGGREVYPWIFNIADVALVVGVAAIMICLLRQGRAEKAAGK